jgi:hypothetical protein
MECLLANFHQRGDLTYSPEFLAAIKRGIQSRLEYAISDGRRRPKSFANGCNGRDELKWSSERIQWYLELAHSESFRPSASFLRVNLPSLQIRHDREIVWSEASQAHRYRRYRLNRLQVTNDKALGSRGLTIRRTPLRSTRQCSRLADR